MTGRIGELTTVTALAVPGIGEVTAGADLAALIVEAAGCATVEITAGDIVVVASKVVAKAEGRTVPEAQRDAAIVAESVREVASRRMADGRLTRVVQTRSGPVLAAAGVDASDVDAGTVLLLPDHPDRSARSIREGLARSLGVRPAVLITDTSGRPWRCGVADFALGAAGLTCLDDLRGTPDASGRTLSVTVRNLADEIACLADLVKGKSRGTPVAVVSGLPGLVTDADGDGAANLVRVGRTDWFRYGHVEAVSHALDRGRGLADPPSLDPDADHPAARVGRAVATAVSFDGGEQVSAQTEVQQRVGGDHGDDVLRVRLDGPAFALGRALERLLTAAWAHDLQLIGPADPPPAAGRPITVTLRSV